MALVVLVDAYCTCWDIDARAAELTPDREAVLTSCDTRGARVLDK